MNRLNILLLILSFTVLQACKKSVDLSSPPFKLLTEKETGIHFTNNPVMDLNLNIFNYLYFYNGGGVASGDFNNDGLIDLYFTANTSDNKLYLNQGKFSFKDVTDRSGSAGLGTSWTTGVTTVDINQDGLLDIYINQVSDFRSLSGHNLLLVCQYITEDGIPIYKDEAAAYNLDGTGFGTQAVFFDYDLDGDLDMFQLNHSVHENGTFGQRKHFSENHPLAGDRFYINKDGIYELATKQSGIKSTAIGYGLGIAVNDINNDGWPDLYIGNDFHENDYLYINQKNGTFKDVLEQQIMHTSRFSMGVDINDINNDGYSDIITLDMLPEDPYILKSSLGEDEYDIFDFKLKFGYNHQYARNNLQINNINNTFSEVGAFSGVHATDWSWAPLMVDFDHDGFKDIFISNGIPKRMNDIDYVNNISGSDLGQTFKFNHAKESDLEIINTIPEIKLQNKFFRNTGDLHFDDLSNMIPNHLPSYSNGATYADLDNDGDIEIITNNIQSSPYIYRNMSRENVDTNHYISLDLIGTPKNRRAIGSKLIVYKKNQIIIQDNNIIRGYQSSITPRLNIGIGDVTDIDSIHLIWPDGNYQTLDDMVYDSMLQISWRPGLRSYYSDHRMTPQNPYTISEVSTMLGLDYQHVENNFIEFNRERLLPHMNSTEGPALTIGDFNGDHLDDVFIGSAKRRRSAIFLQTPSHSFIPSHQEWMRIDSLYEDVDAQAIDIDQDNDLDLIIASGGNEFYGTTEPMQPRLYINDGNGLFTRQSDAFKDIYMTASVVRMHDINRDGLIDIFFGGRVTPWNYGESPKSYIMLNQGSGRFTDQTLQYLKSHDQLGMVTDALWADIDGDQQEEFIITSEWGNIEILKLEDNKLISHSIAQSSGLWNCITAADIDQDGDVDLVAGNLGFNSKLHASPDEPLTYYYYDFDHNGQNEAIITYFHNHVETILPNYKEITSQLPHLKKKFLSAHKFAKATFKELLDPSLLNQAKQVKVTELGSTYFENTGNFKFIAHHLPDRLQWSPIRTIHTGDFNKDGRIDIMTGGNFYANNVQLGRYDADFGNILTNGPEGLLAGRIQSLNIPGQIRHILPIRIGVDTSYILARNNQSLNVISVSITKN